MAYGTSDTLRVGIASTEYAQRTRHLINHVTELRALGAQTVIDLPRIAVIGNQSAGKSSLVEAICGITVPRASGTCTRCPMECRLQNSSGQWQCQVRLRFEKDEYGQRAEKVKEIPFGPLLTDKGELENMLRRAQLAVLNPTISYKEFIDFDLSMLNDGQPPEGSQKFSPNVVCVDLSGPDLVDLSFIDLPGIISNVANKEDRSNIGLVKELVKEHIQGNALILLTLTMRDDLENQSAAFLAKEADPDGLRTIGVLTKADTILPTEETGWFQVLEGQRHPLKHGYYVTKQPGPDELAKKPSHKEAREQEKWFFAQQEPWKSSSSGIKARTGVSNLTGELSSLLSQLIMKTLPQLREDAVRSRNENDQALGLLPPPLTDSPVTELLRLLTNFTNVANKCITGDEEYEKLLQTFRSASAAFKINILMTTPNFRPFESPADEDDNDNFFTQIEDDTDDPGSSPMYLPEIRGHIQRSLTRQLPYNVPYSAKRTFIERSFSKWNDYASAYFEVICKATEMQLRTLVDDHFSRFVMSPLRDRVQNLIDDEINRLTKITEKHIIWFLELESPPFTQNTHYFSSLREKYLANYKAVRQRQIHGGGHEVLRALGALASAGFNGLTEDDLQKLHPPDEYEEELIVMAEVSAYVRIAYKRVIDDIPRIVDHDFLHGLSKGLQDALVTGIGLGSENAREMAQTYLMEDPGVVENRKVLVANGERLEAVLKKLFTFGVSTLT